MYARIGAAVSRYWGWTILVWIALAGGIRWAAPDWDEVTQDGDLAFLPEQMTSVQAERLLARAFPDNRFRSQIVLVCERPTGPLQSPDFEALDRVAARFTGSDVADLPIVAVWTPWTDVIGKKLISTDRRAALVVLQLSSEFMAVENIRTLAAVQEIVASAGRADALPEGLSYGISGSAAIGGDMLSSAKESIENVEIATIALVLIILLAVYRAPALVFVPLATLVVAVYVSLDLVALLTQASQLPGFDWMNFKVFKTTKIFVLVVLFGSGTDYCLFLIARYREELQRGLDYPSAMNAALGKVGAAIVGSALTTILGLGTMVFADFGKYRNGGPAIALCLAVALVACLTLAPALLRAFGGVIFWPWGIGPANSDDQRRLDAVPAGRFWTWMADIILARPGTVLALSLLALAPLAWRGSSVQVTYNLLEELRDDRPSVLGTQSLRRHFFAGDTGPVSVVAQRPGAKFDTPKGERDIARLTRRLFEVPGVKSVRSISEPMGDAPGYRNLFSAAGRRKLAAREHPRTRALYLSQAPQLKGEVTRLDVILAYDPFSADAVEALNRIDRRLAQIASDRDSAWFGTRFLFAGTTSGVRDLTAVTQSDQTLIQRLVVLAVLAVLLLIIKRPVISIYLILSVLFTYFVTIGAAEMVFDWLYEPFSGLDWKVPLFLFVILTAVGEDYNIFLVTRVLEEQKRHGPREGLKLAIVRTGGIITSCGVIMAGTFFSMMFGTLRGMLELGFALSLGVMLDTVVVRPILVPAFLALLDRMSLSRAPLTQSAPGDFEDAWTEKVPTN